MPARRGQIYITERTWAFDLVDIVLAELADDVDGLQHLMTILASNGIFAQEEHSEAEQDADGNQQDSPP